MVTGAYYIVLLDLYPTYQPLYAWYMAGKVTNLDADIVKMQQAVKTHLMLAATKRGLLYVYLAYPCDFTLTNAIRKVTTTSTSIMCSSTRTLT